MNIFLTGPRGSGKSSVGRALAARLSRPFIDTDLQALARFRETSVVRVWASYGEPAWRDAEVECLREAIEAESQVIALGGGVPMIQAARDILERVKLERKSQIVYLRCRVATLVKRLERDSGDRPPLADKPLKQEVAETLMLREPTYLALADLVVPADGPVEDVVNQVASELAKAG